MTADSCPNGRTHLWYSTGRSAQLRHVVAGSSSSDESWLGALDRRALALKGWGAEEGS